MVSRFSVLGVAACCLLMAGAVAAQSPRGDASKEHPGVVRMDWAESFSGREPNIRIQLSRTLLRVISSAAETNEEIRGLIDSLVWVQVVVYEEADSEEDESGLSPGADVLSAVKEKVAELKEQGWESGVGVSEEDESVNVLIRSGENDTIAGVAVFVAEEGELVFVNAAGDVPAEVIGSHLGALLRGNLDMEELLDVDVLSGLLKGDGEVHSDSPLHQR